MLFNSHLFLLAFLPLVWVVFRRVRQRPAVAEAFLIAASLVFYAWGEPWLVLLIGGAIAANFLIAQWLGGRQGRSRTWVFVGGITANIALLAYFKYADFLIENVNLLLDQGFTPLAIALPLGISFFTFQQIGYLVDVKGGQPAERSLRRYALFIAFFPQLVAGPIVHHRHFIPQVVHRTYQRVRAADLGIGLTLIAIGLAKKVLFADSVAPIADAVFGEPDSAGSADAWLGTLAFTLQIYFDFSGYADIAGGLGRLFGFRLPVNFRSPYQAASIIEFWRRWHITLSNFLRDYVYIPLGGNRQGTARRLLNVLLVMLIGGLWHGASWTFVGWGALHGALLIVNHGWRFLRGSQRGGRVEAIVGRAATFTAVVAAWVLFRVSSFDDAVLVYRALADVPGAVGGLLTSPPPYALRVYADAAAFWMPTNGLYMLAALLIVVWFAPNAEQISGWIERRFEAHGPVRMGVGAVAWAAGVVLAVAILSIDAPREFIYFRF